VIEKKISPLARQLKTQDLAKWQDRARRKGLSSEEGTIYRAPTLSKHAKLNGAQAPKLHKGKYATLDLEERIC